MEQDPYIKLSLYLKRLNNRMFHSLLAYYNWKHLFLLRDNNTYREDAEKHVKILNKYKNFFVQSEESNLSFFVINIVKFFDTQSKALTIKKLKNTALQEKDNITANKFLENNEDRQYVEQLAESYEGITLDVINKIQGLIDKNSELIGRLQELRHNLAHDFIESPETLSVPAFEKIEPLFIDIQEMINLMSGNMEHYTTAYSHVEDEVKDDLLALIRSLM